MNNQTKQQKPNQADNNQIPYKVFNEIKNNIGLYNKIQLDIIYNKIHNDNNLDFKKELKNSKTLSEKILYFYASKGIELRTFDIKTETNIAGMYISKKDNRVRVRFANSPTAQTAKDKYKTLAKVIALLKASGISPKAFKKLINDCANYHAHHINEDVKIDTEDNIKLLYKTHHQNHHQKPKPKPKKDSYTYINKKAEKPSIPAVVKSLEKNKQMKKYNNRL